MIYMIYVIYKYFKLHIHTQKNMSEIPRFPPKRLSTFQASRPDGFHRGIQVEVLSATDLSYEAGPEIHQRQRGDPELLGITLGRF